MLIGNESRLLLPDEPAAGMTSEETAATGRLIRYLADEHRLTIIIAILFFINTLFAFLAWGQVG